MIPFFVSGQAWNVTKSGKTLDQHMRDFAAVDGSASQTQEFLKFIARPRSKRGSKKIRLSFAKHSFTRPDKNFSATIHSTLLLGRL
jgi:hypothetical protein